MFNELKPLNLQDRFSVFFNINFHWMFTKISLFFTTFFLGFFAVKAQDFSNKGRDFWVGYGYHQAMVNDSGGTQQMVLYFATEGVTTITISIPSVVVRLEKFFASEF